MCVRLYRQANKQTNNGAPRQVCAAVLRDLQDRHSWRGQCNQQTVTTATVIACLFEPCMDFNVKLANNYHQISYSLN